MAAPSRIEANPRNAQKSPGQQTDESKDRLLIHALKHGMRAGVNTRGLFQTVERTAPISQGVRSSTASPGPAKFEISQNEPNFVNIEGAKALGGDHPEERGLDAARLGRRTDVGRALPDSVQ